MTYGGNERSCVGDEGTGILVPEEVQQRERFLKSRIAIDAGA